MSEPVSRVVYDCNVYVQALINWRGPAGECVNRAMIRDVSLFVTQFILDEIRESYLKIPTKYRVTQEQTEELAARVAMIATVVGDTPEVFVYERDPDDAHYVNLAAAVQAKLIVSRDRDLLDLMDHGSAAGSAFQARFPGLEILDPVTFLRRLV